MGTQAQPAVENPAVRLWVAVDPQSKRIIEVARKVAATPATVLIRGESGTGKDLLAQIVHLLGAARNEPFVKIDCASLPSELIESELFGHERGAFTGADAQKRGRLELAGAGTIVLDDVASFSVAAQAKLLRVIEERKFQRLGGTETIQIHSRLVALTNADLERAVADHAFREDLYYRLNVFPIAIPPLRQRRADIIPLAERLLAALCEVHHRPGIRLSKKAAEMLEGHDFPGNGRELKNMLERAVVYGSGTELTPEHLPAHLAMGPHAHHALISLEELERDYIAEVLDAVRGRKSKAADILGISRKTLLEKRKRYKLD